MRCFALFPAAVALSACQPPADQPADPASTNTAAPVAPAPAPDAPPVNPAVEVLSPTPTDVLEDYRQPLRLTGTEPFWGIRIADKITLQRPDHPDVEATNAGPTINGRIAMWNARDFTIRLEPGECSDGMSDNRYPYRATVTLQGEVLKGCAAREDRWPRGGG